MRQQNLVYTTHIYTNYMYIYITLIYTYVHVYMQIKIKFNNNRTKYFTKSRGKILTFLFLGVLVRASLAGKRHHDQVTLIKENIELGKASKF